jgi:hypothetical protein
MSLPVCLANEQGVFDSPAFIDFGDQRKIFLTNCKYVLGNRYILRHLEVILALYGG